jgi:hypothetical protein
MMRRLIALWRTMFHTHDWEMTFPNNDLHWVFVCKCGATITDIRGTF